MEQEEELNILRNILRLITPEEVEQLTTILDPTYKIPLTSILEKYFWGSGEKDKKDNAAQAEDESKVGHPIETTNSDTAQTSQAKILPFNKSSEESSSVATSSLAATSKDATNTSSAIIPAKIKTVRKVVNGVLLEEEEIVEEEKIDRVAYIIEEQMRSKESQRKIKMQEIYDLYKQTAAVAIDQEKKLKGDMARSANVGVLINKKQN